MEKKDNIISTNRKSNFSWTLSDFFVCGIQLKGHEIKSIRDRQVNITNAYCIVLKNEIWIKNMDITQYKFYNEETYNPKRVRKLLLHKIEIRKIRKNLDEKGMALIPTKLFINDKGLAKLQVGLGKGKKTYDKREALKQKDSEREMKRKKREK